MTLRIGIDIGGTFTDLVAITQDGRVLTRKASSTPPDFGEGIVAGLQELLRDQGTVGEVLHASPIGSNAILEGTGARAALITTRGFRDVLEIRDLRMPQLYDLHWTKPPALIERRLRLEVGDARDRAVGAGVLRLTADAGAGVVEQRPLGRQLALLFEPLLHPGARVGKRLPDRDPQPAQHLQSIQLLRRRTLLLLLICPYILQIAAAFL